MHKFILLFTICLISFACNENKQEAVETVKGDTTTYQWEEWTDRFIDGFTYSHKASLNDTVRIFPFAKNVKPNRGVKYGITAEIIESNGKIIPINQKPLDHSCGFVPLSSGNHKLLITNSVNPKLKRIINIEIK